jgi:hypothetical protein
MKWLEMIHLRTADLSSEQLQNTMHQLIDEARKEKGCGDVKVFKRALLDTDLSLHLYHNTKRIENNGSPAGLRIAYTLKAYGMVRHTVWAVSDGVNQ